MSIGLLGLLDDVTALAKVAAASIDDVAGQAAKAGMKAAGAVIDDAAVTPKYVAGFAANRELPIVAKIAAGSIRNKLLILLPAALVLSWLAPWVITPLLAVGGAYLCFEGAEKVFEAFFPHNAHAEAPELEPEAGDATKLEAERVSGAISTDFILSAEIMTIALATLPVAMVFWEKALILGVVGLGITLAVYGAVALIVKADDIGLTMARKAHTNLGRATGRGILVMMPWVMQALSVIGTAAMIWVGGGIVLHGLAEFGFSAPEHFIDGIAHTVGESLGPIGVELTVIIGDGIAGPILGLILIPIVSRVIMPAWQAIRGMLPGASSKSR